MTEKESAAAQDESKTSLVKEESSVPAQPIAFSFPNETLPLSKITSLDDVDETYCDAMPERTFGYGEISKTSDLAGKTIKSKYKILGLIGEGGASNVYLCERTLVGDRVALKMLYAELATDPIKTKRFHLEAATTASIKHPNVITIYDFDFTDEGLPFMVTELLRGLTLFGELQKIGRLPVRRAIQIITPICSALNVAHTRGIVHRDLKPSNVVLHRMDDDTEVIKLIDFGIAKRLLTAESSVITAPGIVFGTPAYMAPEHCLGETLDGRADVYSLGVLLFEMLSGRLPFNAETPTKLMLKHIKETAPSPRTFCPEIPAEVESIVLRAMSKERDKRFPTALEFADALNNAFFAPWLN
ncbi:MAG: serine/threonine-protein kinase [Acidobacteriota bacterium]